MTPAPALPRSPVRKATAAPVGLRRLILLLQLTVLALAMAAMTAPAQELTWPQQITADGGADIVIYQPQLEAFNENSLEGRAALSVKAAATDDQPIFGAFWFEARLETNRDTRTAVIRNVSIGDIRFADATEEQTALLTGIIESHLQQAQFSISVDQLLADLETQDTTIVAAELKHTPPEIILSTEPALLVTIDGEPRLEDIEGSRYERVVNSPFLIVKDRRDHFLYIGSNTWYAAAAVEGPWKQADHIPDDIAGLVEPAEDETETVDNLKIVVATEPTELIVSDGDPSWAPIEGAELLYMDNTDSNAFLELSTQSYFVLLSGRWYRAEGLAGELQWQHVPNDALPAPFGDIPPDSATGEVLAQVAGTVQARAAVLDNTIPQTAAINRDDDSFSVEYDGEPDFAPVEDVEVEYAQNTSSAVFRYGTRYYACDNGVWYESNSPTDGWQVTTEVPDAIYRIPASNPHHNVTYVKVYDVTPTVVHVGYTPGYFGSYYYGGAIVYGTGYYYNPWYGPRYYPRYPTWGFHAAYNPWTGWGFGVSWTNGPFSFSFGTGGSWFGVGGYRPYPRPVAYGGFRKTNINNFNNNNINVNVDNSINIGGGRDRPQSRPNLYDRPQTRDRVAARPTVADRAARPAGGVQNNVFTDRAGNVYQRDGSGSWKERKGGQWADSPNLDRVSGQRPATAAGTSDRPTQRPAASRPAARPQLERDFSARQRGANRTRNFQRSRAGGGRRRR